MESERDVGWVGRVGVMTVVESGVCVGSSGVKVEVLGKPKEAFQGGVGSRWDRVTCMSDLSMFWDCNTGNNGGDVSSNFVCCEYILCVDISKGFPNSFSLA